MSGTRIRTIGQWFSKCVPRTPWGSKTLQFPWHTRTLFASYPLIFWHVYGKVFQRPQDMWEQNGLTAEADTRTQLPAVTPLQPPTATPRVFLSTCAVLSGVWLLAPPWIIAHHAPLVHGYTGVVWHFLLQGIFPTQGWTHISRVACIDWWILYCCTIWEALSYYIFFISFSYHLKLLCVLICLILNFSASPQI